MKTLKINNEIKEILEDYEIDIKSGLCYLLAIYHDTDCNLFPPSLKNLVNSTGIIKVGQGGKYDWTLPLFEGQETAFEWVKDYCKLFKDANREKGGHVRESTARMKKLFSTHPEIRKEDVMTATKMYIINSNSTFLMQPHYFIMKGVGAEKTYNLLDWIDKCQELREQSDGSDLSNTMQ